METINMVGQSTIVCVQEANSAYMTVKTQNYDLFHEGGTVLLAHRDLQDKKIWARNESLVIAFKQLKSLMIFTYLKPDLHWSHLQAMLADWNKIVDEFGEYNVTLGGDVNTSHNLWSDQLTHEKCKKAASLASFIAIA